VDEMRERLLQRFRERRYREGYLEAFLNTRIAAQIKALREARRLSQAQLAKRVGTTQPGISALENVHYTSWSLRTLKKLARAFDVALIVKFESFGKALDEVTGFSEESLAVPPFAKDPAFPSKRPAARAAVGGESHDGVLPEESPRKTEVLLAAAKMNEKHQVTRPAEIRKRLNLVAGDLILFAVDGGRAVLRVEKGGWAAATRGIAGEPLRREGGGEAAVERERESWV